MKLINRNQKENVPEETRQTRDARARKGGGALLMVLLVWAVILVMLRSAVNIGSPLVMFIIMFALLFVVLTIYRYSFMRLRRWWQNFRPHLVRFLSRFVR